MGNKTLNRIVRILILCGMAGGLALYIIVCADVLPYTQRFFLEEGKPLAFTVIAGVLFTLCFLGAEYIAATLFSMMRTLDSDPFVQKNVLALRKMGVTALVVMVLGLATLALHPVPLAVLAAVPVGMCGLFSLVLAQVFQKAVTCKQENDLTV